MIFETFSAGPLQCNCTIVGDEQTGEAIVVDGGDGIDEVVQRLAKHNLRAKLLIHTQVESLATGGRECRFELKPTA